MTINMYLLPIILQIIYFPFMALGLYGGTNGKIIIRFILTSVPGLALIVSFVSPIYLIGTYIYHKDWRNRGVLKPHIYMAISICMAEFIHYLGWSRLNMENFMNPDGMTRGLTEGAIRNGLYLIGISLIISVIVKLFNTIRGYIEQRRKG